MYMHLPMDGKTKAFAIDLRNKMRDELRDWVQRWSSPLEAQRCINRDMHNALITNISVLGYGVMVQHMARSS